MHERVFWAVACAAVLVVLTGGVMELRRVRLEPRGLRLSVFGTAEGIGRALADLVEGLTALSAQLAALLAAIGGDSAPEGPLEALGVEGEPGQGGPEPAAAPPPAAAAPAGGVPDLDLDALSRTVESAPISGPTELSPPPLGDVGALRSPELDLEEVHEEEGEETTLWDRTAVSPGNQRRAASARGARTGGATGIA